MGGKMKLAAFLLGVLAVSGQTTIDPRRKKWKQQEEIFDETTTTTTTTTEATTTSTTTMAPTTLKEKTTTEEFVWEPDQGNGQGDTKELQEQLALNKDEDPVSNTGFTFGSGFSTKGIEANGGGKGGKKKKKDKKNKIKGTKVKGGETGTKKKKDKKPKKPKKVKGKPSCLESVKEHFTMGPGVDFEVADNKKEQAVVYSCDAKQFPSVQVIICKWDKKSKSQVLKVGGQIFEPKPQKQEITCVTKATRSNDLSHCSLEEAHNSMEAFNFASKEYLFDGMVSMMMKSEITASCNPKYVEQPPLGGVLLLECDGSPSVVQGALTYWKPSLTSVADFNTFKC